MTKSLLIKAISATMLDGGMAMKVCFKCNKLLDLEFFYKHKKMKDGHLNKCKECAKLDVRLDRQLSENARIYDRKRFADDPKRREYTALVTKRWKEKYPEKYKANTALNNAVRDKKIIKGSCSVCGETKNIHGHHYDYTKPLDVIWLCPRHHSLTHNDES